MDLQDKEVFTSQKDLTLSQLKEMFEDGDIETSPDYQRDYVYNDKQASKLVESILMGIPIPIIYLCQEIDETYSVIDGQQRITSFARYLKNDFHLSGLLELTDLNGKKYKELDKDVQKRLKNSSLKATILLKQSNDLKYEIFARLNQGAVSLKPQELRNCIYRGSFNDMLEDIAVNNKMLVTLFSDGNYRKIYQERILRFFALKNFSEYKSSILKTMNDYMYIHQNDGKIEINGLKDLYSSTIDIIKQILGKEAFWGYDREKNVKIEKFSGSVYDSIIVPFSFFSKHDLMVHADEIRDAINELKLSNVKYKEDTYAATGSRKRVVSRIMAVYNLLTSITGSVGNDDSNRTFSAEVRKQLFVDGYICSYCNNVIISVEDAEIDHILPFSKGGKTDISNAQLLHRHCNRKKSDSTTDIVDDDWDSDNNS